MKILFLWPNWATSPQRLCHSEDSQRIFDTLINSTGLSQHQIINKFCHAGYITRGKKPPIKTCRMVWQEMKKDLDVDLIVPVGSVSFQTVLGNAKKISVWGGRLLVDDDTHKNVFGVMHPDQVSYAPAATRELSTQLTALSKVANGSSHSDKTQHTYINEVTQAVSFLESMTERKTPVAFDFETTGLDVFADGFRVRTVSFSWEVGKATVVCLEPLTPWVKQAFIKWLVSPTQKIAHNAKYEARVCLKVFGVAPKNLQCTMLMHHLVDEESGHGLDVLASSFTDMAGYDTELLKTMEQGYTWSTVPLDVLAAYNAADADVTLRSYKKLKDEINTDRNGNELTEFYNNFARPMLSLLAEMEHNGMHVDESKIDALEAQLQEQINNTKAKIAQDQRVKDTVTKLGLSSVDELNLKSPAHTSCLLFDVAGFAPATTTKTGAASTADLEQINSTDLLVSSVVDIRACLHDLSVLRELKSNVRKDSCVSSDFYQPGTVTWRLASKKPPLQNLPRNGRVKSVFTSRWDGGSIVQADFSQLEVRVLGNLTGEPKFEHAFSSGYDFHTYTASQIFQVNIDQVNKEQRNSAKRVNFGVIFGIGPKKLASQIGCNFITAKKLLDDFFLRYDKVHDWVENNRKSASRVMRTVSQVGQVRRLRDARHADQFVRWRAQRQGVNFLIAAFGAAMTQHAMLNIRSHLKKHTMRSLLVGQVHDSIILDCPADEVATCGQLLHYCMTTLTRRDYPVLKIPLKADVTFGSSYGDQEHSLEADENILISSGIGVTNDA